MIQQLKETQLISGKFGQERRGQTYDNKVVGPGTYDLPSMFTTGGKHARGYSLGKADRTEFAKNRSPGPGTYDFNNGALTDGPRWKMGKQVRYKF